MATALGPVPGTNQVRLAIGLPLHNTDALTNLLQQLYDPTSPQYHHYLKRGEFADRFGPTLADYAAVMDFARSNGLSVVKTHQNRLLLDVTGQVSDVQRAFHVRLNSYRHPTENRTFYSADTDPVIAAGLPIQHISGLSDYYQPRSDHHVSASGSPVTPAIGSGPGGTYLSADFRNAYAPGCPLMGDGQSVGLVQFDAFFANDITNYAATNGFVTMPQIVVVPVDGGVTTPGGGNDEVALDIEMVMAMAPGISNIFVYEATNNISLYDDVLNQMAMDDSASQLSSSWFGGAPDPTGEAIFLQMAAQGQTFFCASGDSDAYTGGIPFPDDSPHVTVVGGTTLTTDDSGNYVSETAWNVGFDAFSGHYVGTGGGASPFYEIPSWQMGIDMTTNLGSMQMRNLPDVALTADNVFIVANDGQAISGVGGTSCSAPLWAAFTALANEQAGQLAQPPVGFLNPAIYAICRGTNYPQAFHDVTAGNNFSGTSPANFPAVTGYDLCTGWGTPSGTNLINALIVVDPLIVSPQACFAASAVASGPFSPTNWTLTLSNSGPQSVDWTLGGSPVWLNLSAEQGTLAPGVSTNITLQLNAAAVFPSESVVAGITVTNLETARVQAVEVRLDCGVSVLQNGGFEAGRFTHWTLVGDTIISNNIYNAVASGTAITHSGGYGALLGEFGFLATLSQTVPTVSNQLYQISGWLISSMVGTTQEFQVNWNGSNLVDLVNPPALNWTNFVFIVPATNTSMTLQIAAQNDPNFFGLDDVSVTPIPPVVFNQFFIDSSNDMNLGWYSLPGLNYQVQMVTNLNVGNWQSLGTITAATNTCSFEDTNIVDIVCRRFYRLVLGPP